MDRTLVTLTLALFGLACASPPSSPRIDAPVLVPGTGERVALDQLVVLVDSSASLPKGSLYRDQKALLESFARSAPKGRYETSMIQFGGFRREVRPLAVIDREAQVAEIAALDHLDEGSPIHTALGEAAAQLEGRQGRAAVMLYTDGVLTDGVGRPLDNRIALDAAARLVDGHQGTVCFHTVQTAENARGAALLEQLARVTDCGSFRSSRGIDGVAALHQLERQVFLGAAPALPVVAAAPSDRDRDGVLDGNDLCPGTPFGAAADARGCWTVRNLHYATNSAKIEGRGSSALDEVASVLEQNPKLRVRIEGHADSRGAARYNQVLSQQRAEAARTYLIKLGIAPSRLEATGFGESRPVLEGSDEKSWSANRRTEITVLR